jgi:iron complex outermembrane receptor protein
VLNIVTKKPLAVQQSDLSFSGGNFGYFQPEVDVTGPIGSGTALRYRMIGSYQQRESYIDFVEPEALQIAPSLEWSLRPDLIVRYQLDLRRNSQLRYISLPFVGTVSRTDELRLPRALFTGEPGQGLTRNDGEQHTLMLERSLGAVTRDRLYARLTDNRYFQPSVAPNVQSADGRTLTRRYNQFDESEAEAVFGGQFVRQRALGQSLHTVSFAFDVARWSYDSEFVRGSVPPLDLLNPQYGAVPTNLFTLADSRDEIVQGGLSLQDALAIGDRLTLLVGGRVDRVTLNTEDREGGTDATSTNTQFSPRVGAAYEVVRGIVPFVSLSRSFLSRPAFGSVRTRSGETFAPERGRQIEAGLKLDLGGRVMSTFSVYDLERSNVPTADPDDPAFQVLTGLQRSRGFEFLSSWEPTPQIAFFGSYSYTDARVINAANFDEGAWLDNVPYNSGRLWSRWSTSLGSQRTLGLMFGLTYADQVAPGIGSALRVPGYTVLDGGAFLELRNLSAQLNAQNLTDDFYFVRGAFGGTGVIPGDARRVMLTLRWRR